MTPRVPTREEIDALNEAAIKAAPASTWPLLRATSSDPDVAPPGWVVDLSALVPLRRTAARTKWLSVEQAIDG